MSREELLMAWDALENIKCFLPLNPRNRYGLEIAQKIIMEKMQAGETPPAETGADNEDHK